MLVFGCSYFVFSLLIDWSGSYGPVSAGRQGNVGHDSPEGRREEAEMQK